MNLKKIGVDVRNWIDSLTMIVGNPCECDTERSRLG